MAVSARENICEIQCLWLAKPQPKFTEEHAFRLGIQSFHHTVVSSPLFLCDELTSS